MCVCVCFWIYECFASMLRYVFESLICCLDLWLCSLFVAFIFMCFSSIEKLLFFKLDSFSTNSLSIEPSFSFLDRSLIDSLLLGFSARQILDRIFDPSSYVFYLKDKHDSDFIFLFSLSIENFLSCPKPLSHSQIFNPLSFSACSKPKSLGKCSYTLLFHTFMHF